MRPELFWVASAHAGRLAVAERPRGGHWLRDDLVAFREAGVDILVCALTGEEPRKLWLEEEAHEALHAGLEFVAFPVPNMLVPEIDVALPVLERLADRVQSGNGVAAHCHAGVGRSPLIIASLLGLLGDDPDDAWQRIAATRGRAVPDTNEQRRWVDRLVQAARRERRRTSLEGPPAVNSLEA